MTEENKQDLMTPAIFNGLCTLEKAKYLRKHAEYITAKNAYDRFLTKIYLVSDFFVERTFDIKLDDAVEDIRAINPEQEDVYLKKIRAIKLHKEMHAADRDFFEERKATPGAISGTGCWRSGCPMRTYQIILS